MVQSGNYLSDIFNKTENIWSDNLIRQEGPGHTKEVADLNSVHSGRTASLAYAAGRFTGNLSSVEGLEILIEISKLQITDSADAFYGCFRWYREETKQKDTNAAFFTLEPLVVIRLFHQEILSETEKNLIDNMLLISSKWFIHECSNPILYYTNKIISDGAMLAAIGCITDDKETYKIAEDFFEKWLDYTETRGYGWGENLSLGYNSVILRAFNVIKKVLDPKTSEDMIARFEKQEQYILDIFRFHNGYEFVPTIRSYNIIGNPKPWSLVYNLAGVRGYGFKKGDEEVFGSGKNDAVYRLIADYMIYGNRLYTDDKEYIRRKFSNKQVVPRIGEFKIMDDKKSYTWLGVNGGIGSINEFPIIEGSYQHKTWGLGWQCFPVSAIVYDNQVSFLRFYVNDGKRIRCHPFKDKHSTFLDPSLFSESYYPDVKTSCRQSKQTLAVFRNINKLRNKASEISDSFEIQSFKGKWTKHTVNEREWIVVRFDKACILVAALIGNPATDEASALDMRNNIITAKDMEIEVIEDAEGLRLVQQLYSGRLKVLNNDRLSAGWLFQYIDGAMTPDEMIKYLDDITVIEECIPDGEIPRMPEWNIHDLKVSKDNELLLDIRYDPYKK